MGKEKQKVLHVKSNTVFLYKPEGNSVHFSQSQNSQLKLLYHRFLKIRKEMGELSRCAFNIMSTNSW